MHLLMIANSSDELAGVVYEVRVNEIDASAHKIIGPGVQGSFRILRYPDGGAGDDRWMPSGYFPFASYDVAFLPVADEN